MYLLSAAAAVAMTAAFLVESSSWWIKGACPPGMVGLYVSRSNIYLYFGRFFALAYNALIAFGIENGATARQVSGTLAIGFGAAFLAHLVMLSGGRATRVTMTMLGRILLLPHQQWNVAPAAIPRNKSIVLATATASLCFGLGISLPLLLAVFVPQYRMSLSYVGQTVNALGTILLLFMVDQRLFRSLDEGSLLNDLPSYSLGRAAAFGTAGVICALIYGSSING
ncbi:hypothetical protein [Sphingomonas sp. RIT328]|uniref:hypothetical protein n=1 Tax=Sphingomonas sp. RIT328 TaxID=1470591 RepID=UPI00126810D4|nr:hypothetical protein [Sphingomonas sp. RIT328]